MSKRTRVWESLFKFMLWRAPWLRSRYTLIGLAAWDAAALCLSYNLTFLSRLGRWEGVSLGLAGIIGTWLSVSYLLGRYSPTRQVDKANGPIREVKTLVAACAVVALFIGHSWFYQVYDAQTRFRGFLIPLVGSGFILSTIGQAVTKRIRTGEKGWVLIGSKMDHATVSREIKKEGRSVLWMEDIPKNISRLEQLIKEGTSETGFAIGEVELEDQVVERLLNLKEQGEWIVPLVSWCEQELQRIPPELIHSEWLVQAEGFGLKPGSLSWRVKRFGDVAGAVTLLMATWPLIALAAVVIWIEDRGPILYSQIRTGLYGQEIRIWKLRSMRVDAETKGARWASKQDPRVTRIGKIIRATRIDELPQLWNVLNGDLSLIGPRPERPEIEEELVTRIPHYRIRHWIRPGLSGWAQVCYPYGASIDDSRMKLSYDLYYIRNANIVLDILITLKTIRLVAGARGASPKEIGGHTDI